MPKLSGTSALAILFFIACSFRANAETIEFPEDELATESVLPVFENSQSVKARKVLLAHRVEVGGGLGLSLNEPFYNPANFNVNLTYHVNEVHGVNLTGIFWLGGLSSYGQDLRAGRGLSNGDTFDPTLAPNSKQLLLANYQFTAYYGKISISKKTVVNLSLFGLAGLGVLNQGSVSPIVADFGLGQNFYFSENLALRFDLKMFIFQGVDLTTQQLNVGTPPPDAGSFAKTTYFNTLLSGGLVFLL